MISPPQDRFSRLGIQVIERGWLSSNNVVFTGASAEGCVVDTGYASHAPLTVSLVEESLKGGSLATIINTHLHSDHCGGNAALLVRWPAEIWVPDRAFDAANDWDEERLQFRAIDQKCDRFTVHGRLRPGTEIRLARFPWQVVAAPGHDPDAVMLFQPDERVLISGDALWENRVAVIFPELYGDSGFGPALQALDAVERLGPRIVIPGHGSPFADIDKALDASRNRIEAFRRDPERHRHYATRALAMFHMLEHRQMPRAALEQWIECTPALATMMAPPQKPWIRALIDRLVQDGSLAQRDGRLFLIGQ